jgi:hypothetical protein
VRERGVPAAVAAIAIATAGGAVADAVREAVREVTVVAIPAVAVAAEEGRKSSQFSVRRRGRSECGPF